jgi:mannose-6-phosphate isomerase-like protein (cupin superfamily)
MFKVAVVHVLAVLLGSPDAMADAIIIDNSAAQKYGLSDRVVRYRDLVPCFNAFIDCRSPGSESKENFTIIGPGVSENPAQFVHIAQPHGFNIGGARQPPGCVNSQHSHETTEVFVAHSGTWRFDIGEHGDAAQIVVRPGDIIALPTGMFRGFTNIGDDSGFLWAVLGGDDPGHVTWAPKVFDMASQYGLILLENGQLIDTVAGQTVPNGARPMARTTSEQVAQLFVPSQEQAETLVWHEKAGQGVTPVIAPNGPLNVTDPFTLERIDLSSGETLDTATPHKPEVFFVHRGALVIDNGASAIVIDEGDTITSPLGYKRMISSPNGCIAYRVSGTA